MKITFLTLLMFCSSLLLAQKMEVRVDSNRIHFVMNSDLSPINVTLIDHTAESITFWASSFLEQNILMQQSLKAHEKELKRQNRELQRIIADPYGLVQKTPEQKLKERPEFKDILDSLKVGGDITNIPGFKISQKEAQLIELLYRTDN